MRNNAVLLGVGNHYPLTSFFSHTCAFARVWVVLQRIEAEYTFTRAWQSKEDKQGEQGGKEKNAFIFKL